MADLKSFHDKVIYYCGSVPNIEGNRSTQRDLAEEIIMDAGDLSNRLSGRKSLSCHDVKRIIEALAKWEAITTRDQAIELLDLAGCEHFSQAQWNAKPLKNLTKSSSKSPWNVPYSQNPYFTGREEHLQRLHEALRTGKQVALAQAISGLGGVGKTQTALEYAYRYRHTYQAVLWARADSRDTLLSDVLIIANELKLPETNQQEKNLIVEAVKHWLAVHTNWLLILDNIEDLNLAVEFLPTGHSGRVLLTTRAHVTEPHAQANELDKMGENEGALFLLRRTKCIGLDASLDRTPINDRTSARNISLAMDGLPLALDQAGAYILETGCTLTNYLDLYNKRHAALLRRRGSVPSDHPDVATTFSIAFENLGKENRGAVELLHFCAFLHSDTIPVEVITRGTFPLSPALQLVAADPLNLDETIKELLKYSLIGRDRETKTLSIHRLVQAVLVDNMAEDEQRLWAECAVRAVNHAFPDVDFQTRLDECERYFPHAQGCASLIIQRKMVFPEAAHLLEQTGRYLHFLAQYADAETLLLRALAIRDQLLGPEHLDTASSLDSLAMLREAQDNYTEAETLYKRALVIREQVLGLDHSDTAGSLDNLADLYRNQGRYVEAEPLFLRALAIREQQVGPNHFDTAQTCNNLALLYHTQKKYAKAEPLFRRALMIFKQVLRSDHSTVATSLNNLAMVCRALENYAEAKTLYQQTLTIKEGVFGPDHPRVAAVLGNLAMVHYDLGEYAKAEELLLRAQTIDCKRFGMESREVAYDLNNLGRVFVGQGRYAEAEPLFQCALRIREQKPGPEHPETADTLDNLADLYHKQGRYAEAEPLFQRALHIRQQRL